MGACSTKSNENVKKYNDSERKMTSKIIKVEPKVGKSMDFMSIVSNLELLDIIMSNRDLFDMFKSYLKSTYQHENLEFFMSIEKIQRNSDSKESEEELKKIYSKFIKRGSEKEINISDLLSKQINANRDQLKAYIEAKKTIIGLMATNCLPGFVAQIQSMPDGLLDSQIKINEYVVTSPHEWIISVIPIAESLPLCVTISDFELGNKLIYVNQQFVHITGYSRVFSMNKNCKFLQGEKTENSAIDKMKTTFKKKEKVEVKITNYTRNGDPFVNFLYLRPVFMTSNRKNVKFYLGFQVDIEKQSLGMVDKVVNTFPEYIYEV